MKHRPLGFTLLALLFAWLTIAGLGHAVINFAGKSPFSSSAVFGLLALAYAGAAGSTATGLWRVRTWAVTSLRLWMVVCAVLLLWVPIGAFRSLESPPRVSYFVPLVSFSSLIVGFFWLLDRYIRRKLRPAA